MDFVKNAMSNASGNAQGEGNSQQNQSKEQGGESGGGGGGFLSGIGNKLNTAAGGGRESEKDEDLLDKGVDAVQQYGLGQGDQSNESAVEQAKDEQISDFIRSKYKEGTGSDFPIKDKPTRFG